MTTYDAANDENFVKNYISFSVHAIELYSLNSKLHTALLCTVHIHRNFGIIKDLWKDWLYFCKAELIL